MQVFKASASTYAAQSLTGSSSSQDIAESSYYFSTMWPLSAVVCSLFVIIATTDVGQCPGKSIEGLKDVVTLSPCKRLPCRLKKNTRQNITIAFTPDADMDEVNNKVLADVFGVSLPFVGVDGISVCDKLETERGEKTTCPVKAGTKYVYKDSFPILPFYPSIEAVVHWSLIHNKKDLICFKVPVKIV